MGINCHCPDPNRNWCRFIFCLQLPSPEPSFRRMVSTDTFQFQCCTRQTFVTCQHRIWGALKRNYLIEVIYFISFIICTFFLLLGVVDFSDILQLLPRAPKGASSSFRQQHAILADSLYPISSTNRFSRFVSSQPTMMMITHHSDPTETQKDIKNLKNIYDKMPFVPHPDETEKDSEEIARTELSPDLQIALTFLLNNCTSLDELTGNPKQFEPTVEDDEPIRLDEPQQRRAANTRK
ncbi:hypothetical protein IE077_001548 [Cardiosporidium cionae]|uniref:Uncharacterized protein n=1 Tax=Cardiosporidium cionae TaxID=476202 RepID=A0ABQ7J5B4_9APIC|nr:hypothetical protein IE077_001548 [Cardiosporidium cionae]|eukprot:KAF8819158.1 hypothetical protein IE077_001548 [Cardiosporidium cionae]